VLGFPTANHIRPPDDILDLTNWADQPRAHLHSNDLNGSVAQHLVIVQTIGVLNIVIFSPLAGVGGEFFFHL
jgi:hypothetical protein